MSRRPAAVGLAILLIASAYGNGAMGLGLEQWDPRYWTAYVFAMVLFEAWYIGAWLQMAWPKAITISIVANLFTGIGCGLMGCCAVFLHFPMVGSAADPNPLLSAVALLSVWAVPSALIEALFWRRMFVVGRDQTKGEWKVFGRTILAHLVSIPIGLAILLIPERPYIGMESWAAYQRRMGLFELQKDLMAYVDEHGQIPKAGSISELMAEVPRQDKDPLRFPRELSLYEPEFRRFDFGDAHRRPFRINSALRGRKVDPETTIDKEQYEWYLSPSEVSGRWKWSWGIQVEPRTGQFRRARFPEGTPAAF